MQHFIPPSLRNPQEITDHPPRGRCASSYRVGYPPVPPDPTRLEPLSLTYVEGGYVGFVPSLPLLFISLVPYWRIVLTIAAGRDRALVVRRAALRAASRCGRSTRSAIRSKRSPTATTRSAASSWPAATKSPRSPRPLTTPPPASRRPSTTGATPKSGCASSPPTPRTSCARR